MSRGDRHQRLADARERADDARLRFAVALQSTRDRVMPDRLKADARNLASSKAHDAKQSLRQSIRRHPLLSAAAVLGGLALMFWAPARYLALFGARASQLIWMNRNLWKSSHD
ncbi:MAG TPA: hypothetical protein VNS79_15405 [Sphingobium sp.]|nr:hypothetical protein [Sphingobium sp.]